MVLHAFPYSFSLKSLPYLHYCKSRLKTVFLSFQVFTPTGQELKFEKEDQRIFLLLPDGRRIALLQTDIETDFGLLHEVESVLL